ncbi:phosphatase PAP2 family protein [Nitrospirillum bahiense]|uniref:PAP2 superfamily protein n=1 Tax=Nitrospirillum amazonense TaxID=28077 RepID=A0A560GDB6_9PROT|nr:phosphatase PAP2 family protein [Nitrospirillum amazonense]TWB31902.1 PAP2 superfamily protein [Nitrospirillum amazonense]
MAWAGFLVLEAGLVLWIDRPFTGWAADLPPWIRALSHHLTRAGDSLYSLVPLGLAAIALVTARAQAEGAQRERLGRWLGAVVFVFLAVALSGLAVDAVKAVVGRPRPVVFLTEGAIWPQPFHMGFRYYSFPSGHADTLVALALSVGILWPRGRLGLLALALALATTRLWVGAHYPSDVLGGAATAVLTTRLLRDSFTRRGWLPAPDGAMVRPQEPFQS